MRTSVGSHWTKHFCLTQTLLRRLLQGMSPEEINDYIEKQQGAAAAS